MSRSNSELIYLDTNIYRDFLEDRVNIFGRPLGEKAGLIFDRGIACEFMFIISDWVIHQLSRQSMLGRGQALFQELIDHQKVKMIVSDEADKEKARKLGDFDDGLHAILAHKAGAKYLITRNKKDFLGFRNLVEPKLPEEL